MDGEGTTHRRAHQRPARGNADSLLARQARAAKSASVALRLPLALADPGVITPAGMLALQKTAGNRAAVGLMRNGQVRPRVCSATVQRQSTAVQRQMAPGLASSKVMTAFAASAYEFWKGRETSTRPLEALGRFLVAEVNKQLPYPCGLVYDAAIDPLVASFHPRLWTIRLNMGQVTELPEGATVGQLKRDEVTELADSVYHEARHSEQYFRVAQMKMATQGWAAVAAEMEINPSVALVAWMTRTGDRRSAAEVKAWEPWVGRYATYKRAVQELTGHLKTLTEYLGPEYVKDKVHQQRALWPTRVTSPAASARMMAEIASDVRDEILDEIAREGTMTGAQASVGELVRAAAAIRHGGRQSKLDRAVLLRITGIKRAVAALQQEYRRLQSTGPGRNLPTLRSLAGKAYHLANAAYRGAPTEADAHRLAEAAARRFKARAGARGR